VLGVEFADEQSEGPKRIAALAGEVLWLLGGRSDDPWVQAQTRVAVQLSLRGDSTTATLSGSLGLRNRIRFVRTSEKQAGQNKAEPPLEHRMTVHLDRVGLPLSALVEGTVAFREGEELQGGAVCDHAISVPGGEEEGELRWQCAQVVRWTSYGNYARRYLPPENLPPVGMRSLLVLDAGVAFALAAADAGPPAPAVSDLEYGDLRLGLAATKSDVLEGRCIGDLRGKRPVVLVRLPVLGVPTPLIPVPPWSIAVPTPAAGKMPCDAPGAICLKDGLGPQWPPLADPGFSGAASRGTPSLLRRSQLAEWIASDSIQRLAFVAPEKPGEPPPLAAAFRLAFVKPRSTTAWHILPTELGDLGPVLADARAEKVRWYDAAMLVTPYTPGAAEQVMRSARVLDFPYAVARLPDDAPATAKGVPVELAVFTREQTGAKKDRLTVIASEQLETGDDLAGAVLRWARGQLQDRDRRDGALAITREYETTPSGKKRLRVVTRPVPRLFEAARRELTEPPPWAAQPTPEPAANRALPLAAAGGRLPATRLASAELGCLAFAAAPAGDAGSENPLPPGTRFRLTHLAAPGERRPGPLGPAGLSRGGAPPPGDRHAGGVVDQSGRLRPAVARPPGEGNGGVLALTKWDHVPFEAYARSENAGPGLSVPPVSRAAVLHRPGTVTPEELRRQGDGDDAEFVSLLPPLCDVLASASRPGEMTRTTWSVSEQRGGAVLGLATGPAATVGLRRPRARAGARQCVRLQPVEGVGRPMVDGKYFFSALGLTQVVEAIGEPEPPRCEAVLTTLSRIFGSSASADTAATAPALVGFLKVQQPAGAGEKKVKDRCALYLVAHDRFRPERRSKSNKLVGKTLLFWSDQGKPPATLGQVDPARILLQSIPAPATGAGWEEHGVTSWVLPVAAQEVARVGTRVITAADRLDDALEYAVSHDEGVFLLAWTYGTPDINADPEVPEGQWVPDDPEAPVFAIKVRCFDRGSTVRRPSLVYTLLAESRADAADLTCGGHGALFDEDFTPITPHPAGRSQPAGGAPGVNLEWGRNAQLAHLEPLRFDATAAQEADPYLFDIVAYGTQGELIRTDKPAPPGP
jgi:hypothetical protein